MYVFGYRKNNAGKLYSHPITLNAGGEGVTIDEDTGHIVGYTNSKLRSNAVTVYDPDSINLSKFQLANGDYAAQFNEKTGTLFFADPLPDGITITIETTAQKL